MLLSLVHTTFTSSFESKTHINNLNPTTTTTSLLPKSLFPDFQTNAFKTLVCLSSKRRSSHSNRRSNTTTHASLLEAPVLWAGRLCIFYALLKAGLAGSQSNLLVSELESGSSGAGESSDLNTSFFPCNQTEGKVRLLLNHLLCLRHGFWEESILVALSIYLEGLRSLTIERKFHEHSTVWIQQDTNKTPMQTMIWKAPAFGSLKINCDAAVVEKEVCVAAVVKNPDLLPILYDSTAQGDKDKEIHNLSDCELENEVRDFDDLPMDDLDGSNDIYGEGLPLEDNIHQINDDLVRDWEGNIIAAGTRMESKGTVNQAEAKGIKWAILMAKLLGLRKVEVEGDSKICFEVLIKAKNGELPQATLWETRPILEDTPAASYRARRS
uniref:RNase H type-1 domain-containing protein n=1 Tax=Fagus sylvatica TaxID=28930 RepID=A0A2N9G529_FAGSY